MISSFKFSEKKKKTTSLGLNELNNPFGQSFFFFFLLIDQVELVYGSLETHVSNKERKRKKHDSGKKSNPKIKIKNSKNK